MRDAPWVELCPATLLYVKIAMLASAADDKPDVLRGTDGVRWRKDRKCWLAVRCCDGTKSTKSFKPTDDSPEAVNDTLNNATRWVGGEDVIDDCNCDSTETQISVEESQSQFGECEPDAHEVVPVDLHNGACDQGTNMQQF